MEQTVRIVTFTTNRGYVEIVAPSFAKAPNKKTYLRKSHNFYLHKGVDLTSTNQKIKAT